jgi:hypothetical protein
MIVEPLNSCSSIFSAEGNPVTAGLSLRCSGFGVALAALPLSVALCRLMASKTLPLVSPRSWCSNAEGVCLLYAEGVG